MSEQFFIILAGVPDEMYDYIYKQPSHKIGGGQCEIIISPLRVGEGGLYRYNIKHIESLIAKLYVAFVPKAKSDLGCQMHVFLIYLEHDEIGTINCEKSFFPIVLPYKIRKMEKIYQGGRVFFQARNELMLKIKEASTLLRKKVALIRHELNSHRSTTPLLLPMENFSSTTYQQLMTDVSVELSGAHDTGHTLKELKLRFDASLESEILSERRYYRDDRRLIFKAPPDRLLHGENLRGNTVHGGSGHQEICTVGSRTRLGAPYKASFHYDCELRGGRRITRDFTGCHGQTVSAKRWTHVNVAPNDWVG